MKLTEKILEEISTAGINYARKHTLPLLVFEKNKTEEPQTATGIILKTDKGFILTTAGHVLKSFNEYSENARLQIGRSGIVLKNLSKETITILDTFDFGIIRLEDSFVTNNNFPFLNIDNLGKSEPKKLDLVAYVGFPGCWKTVHSEKLMSITRFECIGSIETIEHDQFSVRIDEGRYEEDTKFDKEMTDAGGLSGAPVFSLFDFWDSKKREPILIGWLYEGMAWGNLAQKHYAIHCNVLDLIEL